MQELTTTTVNASQLPTTVVASSTNQATVNTHQTQPPQPEKKTVRAATARNNRSDSIRDTGAGISGGGSVIGSMTTWHPPTANLTSSRSQLDINVTPPQSIAIVAGRKYIMVPKTNLMSVSPSGEVKIGDNNGIPLPYFDNSMQQPTLHHQFK